MNKDQIKKESEMAGVFNKFDFDKSGTIEINELHQMFMNYGIDIQKHELKSLFRIVDTDGSGALSLSEFIRFSSNAEANAVFKRLIQRIRYSQQKYLGLYHTYLPFNLNRLLDHLSHMAKRESLIQQIDEKHLDDANGNIKNFIKLFILDGSAKDSVVKEESAKLIEHVILKEHKEEELIDDLDDQILEQLTVEVIQPKLRKLNVIRDHQHLYEINEDESSRLSQESL